MIQDQIRFCLVRTTHPGNIGATARAMKTMGLTRLCLVEPARFPGYEVTSLAAGAVDVVDNAVVAGNLAEALSGCELVVGTTARERKIGWPVVDPAEGARLLVEAARRGRQGAVVFGTERSGLSNEDVEHCHQLIRIPTFGEYASLNLAAAAQIIAYEILRHAGDGSTSVRSEGSGTKADAGEMRRFYRHLQQTMHDLDFIKVDHPPVKLMRKIVRLFNRAWPDREEINILRGMLTAAQENLKRDGKDRK